MKVDRIDDIYFFLKSYQLSGIDIVCRNSPNNFYSVSKNLTAKDITDHRDRLNNIGAIKNSEENLYATNLAFKSAEDIAATSNSLEILREKVLNSSFCQLKKYAMNTVFGCGVEKNPDVMIIGEAPGADEDKQGLPFVGVSGQLLDKIFLTIGISRDKNAYISNILKWRPPGNRTPTPEECFICMPIIKRQIEFVNPKIIVLAGGVATKALLNNSDGITKVRGNIFDYDCCGRTIKTIPIFHPSYLLRNPISKKLAYIDILTVKELLQSQLNYGSKDDHVGSDPS